MSLLSFVVRNGLLIGPQVFVLSLALLAFFVRNVIKTTRRARLVSVPLVATQEIEFTEKGRVVLCCEGPLLSTRFAGLACELTLAGRPVESRSSLFRARTSSFSTVRMELRYYDLPARGRYVLSIEGVEPDREPDQEHRIVFMRPHLARSVAGVAGIVFAAMAMVGGLVLSLLAFTSPESPG